MIRHVVLMKFHSPDVAAAAKARLEALPARIPAIVTLEVGLDVLRMPASVDLWLMTTHTSIATLTAYQDDPAHREFRDWLVPRLAGRWLVDSEE